MAVTREQRTLDLIRRTLTTLGVETRFMARGDALKGILELGGERALKNPVGETDHGNQPEAPTGVGPPQKIDSSIPLIAFLPGEAPGKFATDWIGRSSSAAEPGSSSRVSPIPEPGTFALLGIGLAALIAARQRR